MSKLLSVGLMVCGIGVSVQAATAGPWGYGYGDEGCTCPSAAPATAWQAPAAVPPAPAQASPAPAVGQTAQSGSQTYQSFSAEPAPAPGFSSGPVDSAPAPYPTYGGNGFYGSPYYGGSFYGNSYGGDYRRWDNANNHGNPSY